MWTTAVGVVATSTVLFSPGVGYAQPRTETYDLTESTETFTVPEGVCLLEVEAYGAQGADSYPPPAAGDRGGPGAGVSAEMSVEPGDDVSITVGGAGTKPTSPFGDHSGGFNGGGKGNAFSGPGGGATVITAPDDEVVAGGGGGAGGSLEPEQIDLSGGAGGQSGATGHDTGRAIDGKGGGGGTADLPGSGGGSGGQPGGAAGEPGNGRFGGDGGVQDPNGGSGASGGGGGAGATGGGGGGAAARTGESAAGGGGGGGSSSGPDNARFETGVRTGDGQAVLSYDPDDDEQCEKPGPEPDPGPDGKNAAAGPKLPATGLTLSPVIWLAAVSTMLGGVLLLAARRWRSRHYPTDS